MRKKPEFSKRVVVAMLIICCAWVSLSFVLSWFGRDPLETLTSAVVTTLLATIMGYYLTKAFEKNSRNKYGLDADGNPLSKKGEEKK